MGGLEDVGNQVTVFSKYMYHTNVTEALEEVTGLTMFTNKAILIEAHTRVMEALEDFIYPVQTVH